MEDGAEVAGDAVAGQLHGGLRGGVFEGGVFEFERGVGAVGDAAGDDPVEVAEVCGDVEGEAVRGDAAGDVDADGREFFLGDAAARDGPDAGATFDALRGDAEVVGGADEDVFKEADVVDRAEMGAALAGEVAAEVEDGIADELAGAVVGDVAAAVDLVDFDAFGRQEFVGGEDVAALGVAAEGEDGWMLEEDEGVGDGVGFACGDEFGLEAEAFGVGGAGEVEQVDKAHGLE